MESSQRSTAILPAGLWDDLKSVTCLGSKGYDGSIESVITLLMEEDWSRENISGHGHGDVPTGGSSSVNAGQSSGGNEDDVDMSSIRRRKKGTSTNSSSQADHASVTVQSQAHEGATNSASATGALAAAKDPREAKRAAALARLSASHAYLLTGRH